MFPFDVPAVDLQPGQPLRQAAPAQAHGPAPAPAPAPSLVDVLREAEAHQALAELFPHLKLSAMRAIQDLFPLNASRNAVWH